MAAVSSRVIRNKLPLIRAFSTSNVQLKEQAPIKVFGVEGRYAHALFSAASQSNSLDKVETELSKIKELFEKEVKLSAYCSDPTINKLEKKDVVTEVMKATKMSDITTNFMGLLAENSRLGRMEGVFGAFGKIMRAKRGEVDCTVTTAKPLDAAMTKSLNTTLKKFIGPKEILKVETATDPSIMGGMVINLGDYFIDMSTATKVKKLSRSLKGE